MKDCNKFAVVTDIHGAIPQLKQATKEISESDVDQVLVLGDYSPYGFISPEDIAKIDQFTLKALGETKKPVLYIVGSHEPIFFPGIAEWANEKFPHLEAHLNTQSPLRKELDNLVIEAYSGSSVQYTSGNPMCHGSFQNDFDSMGDDADLGDGANKILLTHDPIKCETSNGIDYSNFTFVPHIGLVRNYCNAGHESIRDYVATQKIPITLSGHIHEAGGKGIDVFDGEKTIEERVKSARLNLNPGPLLPTKTHVSGEQSAYALFEVYSEPGEITDIKYEIKKISQD